MNRLFSAFTSLLLWLRGLRRSRRILARWERDRKAKEHGLFDAPPSVIVAASSSVLGIKETDDMRSENLGAPDSPYYQDQSSKEFDRKYSRLQEKTERLLRTLPKRTGA